jgi:hypothetical protein
MSDSSSITGATNPSGLPEKFTFQIPFEEADLFLGMAKRFAPDMHMGFQFQLHFDGNFRHWMMHEQNLTSYVTAENPSDVGEGFITLTINVLEYIVDLFKDSVDTTIEVNFNEHSLSLVNLDTRIEIDLPPQHEKPYVYELSADLKIEVQPKELAHLGRAMEIFPVAIDIENSVGMLPFIEFNYSENWLTAQRDWSAFGGPVVKARIPAQGERNHSFSSYPFALARELYFADIYGSEPLHFCFSDKTPHVALLDAETWGIRIELGNETVFEHRNALVQTLSENEIDVDKDERIGWSPIVNCHFNGSDVAVEIVKGIDGQPDYFRLSTVVLPGSPWNLEIASEINGWNNQWTNVKLVRDETDLIALRDVVAEEMDLTPEAVVDLVTKSKVVAEVVGVFI